MKFTSIVITALVASTQFSSTFAKPVGVADEASFVDGQQGSVTIADLTANDIPEKASGGSFDFATLAFSVLSDPSLGSISEPDRSTGAVTFTQAPGSPGKTGTTSFTYKIADNGMTDKSSDATLVTITIKPTSTFTTFEDIKFPIIGNDKAISTTKTGISDVAAITPGAADPEPILAPVFGNFNTFFDLALFQATTVTPDLYADPGFFNFFNVFRGDGN
jgi:hypothetical protein